MNSGFNMVVFDYAICNFGHKGSGKKDVVTLRVSPCMKVQLLKFATEAGDPTPKGLDIA